MSDLVLSAGIGVAFLGTLIAAIISAVFGRRAHAASNWLLAVVNLIGAVAASFLAFSGLNAERSPVLLPDDFGFTSPLFFDMTFAVDHFAAIFLAVLCSVAALCAWYAIPYLNKYASVYNVGLVNALTALFIFGMQGVIMATNAVGFMFFWEVMSLTSFFLVLADGSTASRKAGFLYLVMSQLSALAIMAGLLMLSGGAFFASFGYYADSFAALAPLSATVALILILFGFGSKAGLVPCHVWLPEAHPQAPSHVSALMSGVMLKVAVYGFLRVFLFMVPGVPTWLALTITVLGALSAIFGVLYAILERDMKRVLAYSSIENIGLIFLMIGVGLLASLEGSAELAQAAIFAGVFLAIAHAFFKSGLFLAAGTVIATVHSRSMEEMGGLAKRMPQFSLIFCGLALAAAALPPFAPFVAEWTLLQAIVSALPAASAMLKVALVVVVATVSFVAGLSLFAMVKLYAIPFLANPRSEAAEQATEPPFDLSLPSAVPLGVLIFMGLLAPKAFAGLGAPGLVDHTAYAERLLIGEGTYTPFALFAAGLLIVACLLIARRLFTQVKFERYYQTWDCGQPLTARMEYTATAFSGPIRFFFRFLLRTRKTVTVTPIVPGNPWIASRTFVLEIRSVWYEFIYHPILRALLWLAMLTARLQNGRVQFYIGLILAALFVTIIVAL